MKTTKRTLFFILSALIVIVYFFYLGNLSPDVEDIGFEERLLISAGVAILFALIVLPFLGKEKMIILRNFLRAIIILTFVIVYFKLRDICEMNESLVLALTITIPPLLFSFFKLKRKKDRGIISE